MSQPAPRSMFEATEAPFGCLLSLARTAFKESRGVPAHERRLLTTHFQASFAWKALEPLLPLQPVVLEAVRPLPARRLRSCYRWLPPEEVDVAALEGLDDFDLVLRLFDFSPWRPILAQRFRSHCGPPVFDPVSLGLGILLARWRGWSWPTLNRELHSAERGQGYCRRLGFDPGDLPSPSTWREALKQTRAEVVVAVRRQRGDRATGAGPHSHPLYLPRRPPSARGHAGHRQPVGGSAFPHALPLPERALFPPGGWAALCGEDSWERGMRLRHR